MSVFKKLFAKEEGSKEPEFEIPWKQLQSLEQLDEIDELSKTKTVVIFKHSTRCGISGMVLRQFKKAYKYPETQVQPYILDLISYREVSNEAAIRYQAIHQSPQLLIIKNGNTVHAASHYEIDAGAIQAYI